MGDSWLRLHTDILDNPKIRELPLSLLAHWVLTMVVAKKHGGVLPSIERFAFEMRISKTSAKQVIDKLCKASLIDTNDGVLTMHDWEYWQFESGTSEKQKTSAALRMKRFRERQRNGGVTGVTDSVTSDDFERNAVTQKSVTNVTRNGSRARTDSETDSDTERNVTTVTRSVTASVTLQSAVCDSLNRICALHPKSDGIAMGRKLLESELSGAINPEELAIAIENRHRIYVESNTGIKKRFIKSLANWVRDNGFMDPVPKGDTDDQDCQYRVIDKLTPEQLIEKAKFDERMNARFNVKTKT